MTYPIPGSAAPADVVAAVRRMRENGMERDAAIHRVRLIREGKFAEVWPDQFPEKYPTSLVANFVDVAARDLAANLSPLPSLACSAGNMRTDADKRRAEKKNRIGANYWRHSRLQTHMKYGADQYLSYGFLPFWVEPDFECWMPQIRVLDPAGSYFELDRNLECRRFSRTWRQDRAELAAQFPEYEYRILRDENGQPCDKLDTEVVLYIDTTRTVLYLPECGRAMIANYPHQHVDERGRPACPVHVALRPGVSMNPRGQFDDVLWTQMASAVMAALTLEAGHKAVQAPLAIPSDVNELSIGPDALLITDSPEKIQRVPLNVPPAVFPLAQQLQQEMHAGAGYPDTRLGNGPAGGSTGRGISALEGGFDTQIRLGQDVLGEALRIATEMCFRTELNLWPKRSKSIAGTLSGESFELTYVPTKDIGTNTSCEVSYGFAAGLSPNSAIVTLLQLRGDQIIGRDTFRRQLPFDIDIEQQQRELDEQAIEDGLKQGLLAGLQSAGQMIATGQVEVAMQFFQAANAIIKGRRQGRDLSDLFDEAFTPPAPPPAQPGAPGEPGQPGQPGQPGEDTPGVSPDGLPQGVAQGQAGLPPGGRPSVTDLAASFSAGGSPNLSANVRRRLATG